MKTSKILLAFFFISNMVFAQIDPDDKININKAKTVDGTSPGLVVNGMASEDVLYDDEYINLYGFGFHGYNDNGGSNFTNPVNAYVSGYFGIDLFTAGKNRFRINEDGNIGIHNSAPEFSLDVLSSETYIASFKRTLDSGVDAGVQINGARSGCTSCDIAFIDLRNFDKDEAGGTDFTMARVTGGMQNNTGKTGYLGFKVNDGSGLNEAMRINKNGYVGIGTSSPGAKLDVAGSIKIPLASTVDNNSPGLIALGSDDFLYDGQYINNYGFGFHGYDDGSTQFDNPRNAYMSGYFGIDLFTGATSRMRISRDGLVSIGSPKRQPGYLLSIDGKVLSEEVKVEDVDGADFVFESNYDLRPLHEIEAFIKANKHLPEVPSAREMQENGVELGKMNMLLLQKIEELTLHQIEQNKKIEQLLQKVEAQDKEITELKNQH